MHGVSRHSEVLFYIKLTIAMQRRMPTYKEVMFDLGITRKVIFRILLQLEADGKIKREPTGMLPFRLMGV